MKEWLSKLTCLLFYVSLFFSMHSKISLTDLRMMQTIMFGRKVSVREIKPRFSEFLVILGIDEADATGNVLVLIRETLGYHTARQRVEDLNLHVGDRITSYGRPGQVTKICSFAEWKLKKAPVLNIKIDSMKRAQAVSPGRGLNALQKVEQL